jgi:hypothetical protein
MAFSLQPYGLRPINKIGGTPFAGSTRAIKIASAYSSNIFNGEAVVIDATTGTLVAMDVGTSPRVVGVFMGCQFTQASSTRYFINSNFWPASTVAADALGHVIDDPFALFQIQADGTVPQTALGENVNVSATSGFTGLTGSTVTGKSLMAAAATTATTAGFPWRLIDFVNNPGQGSTVGDAFTELVVSWNFGIHSYQIAAGV